MSHPRGKIEIVCQGADGKTLFKFHQSKDPADSARAFTVKLKPTDAWLDDDLQSGL